MGKHISAGTFTINTIIGSVTMPAGEYWIGDPCYAIPNDRWMEWLEAGGLGNDPPPKYQVADLDGYPCIGVGTAHGDGCYPGSDGASYPVDAGLIGAVAVEVVEGEPFGMRRVTFEHDFDVSYDHASGTIWIGDISIQTDYDDDYS